MSRSPDLSACKGRQVAVATEVDVSEWVLHVVAPLPPGLLETGKRWDQSGRRLSTRFESTGGSVHAPTEVRFRVGGSRNRDRCRNSYSGCAGRRSHRLWCTGRDLPGDPGCAIGCEVRL